ncbi:MAG: hypothetical protein MI975_00815 [Cytophagales bacterium]|nr:hypothetical protein [Cytophagales bacterium]
MRSHLKYRQHAVAIFIIFMFFVLLRQEAYSGDLLKYGTPFIKHFTKKDYNAGNKNWSVTQDSNGFIYVGNTNGLLQYDGIRWKKFNLPGGTIIRSVYADGSKIYSGSLGEFGYWETDHKFDLRYNSLASLIDHDFGDEEIWWIVKFKNDILFQSFANTFLYDGRSVKKIISNVGVIFPPFIVNGRLFVQVVNTGLFEIIDRQAVFVPGTGKLVDMNVKMMVPSYDRSSIIIGTENNGFFNYSEGDVSRWDIPSNRIFQRDQINRGLKVSDSIYAVGTILGGVYLIDEQGNIFNHIDREKGLNNNTVLSLKLDNDMNLWVGLDNGIDLVKLNSPLYYKTESTGDIGSVYTSAIHNDYLYLGTNRGIFYTRLDRSVSNTGNKFTLVPGSQGQVWNLTVIDGVLFCGHNSATFIVDEDKIKKVSDIAGGYDIMQYPYNDNYIIQGGYSGLFVYRIKQGKCTFSHQIKGFPKLSKSIEFEREDVVWVAHPHRGLYRLELNDQLTEVVDLRAFSADKKTYINKLNNKLVFSSDSGFIYYDDMKNSFSGLSEINEALGELSLNAHIVPTRHDNYWLFKDGECAVTSMDESKLTELDNTSFNDLIGYLIPGHEDICVIDPTLTLIHLDNGFAIYNHDWKGDHNLNREGIMLRELIFSTPLGAQFPEVDGNYKIPFKYNSLSVKLSFPEYTQERDLIYKLDGYHRKWTNSNFQEEISFQNLPFGKYTLKIKPEYSTVDEELAVEFTIHPPWYQSTIAKAGYILLSIIALVVMILINNRKIRKIHEKHELERRRLLEKEASENERKLIEIRNENLRNEIKLRNSRLAKSTFSLIHKNNSLIAIKEELSKVKDELGVRFPGKYFNRIIRNIDRGITSENDWKMFEQSFSEVHENFLHKLKDEYPDLTPADIQLCAYLKMNLSSKEIASLLNITVRGVEIRRYRLRKKLNLNHDTNLVEFIMGY